jgi:hypothetical protein
MRPIKIWSPKRGRSDSIMKLGLKSPFRSSKVAWIILFAVPVFIFSIAWPRLYPKEAVITARIHLTNIPVGLALVGKHPVSLEVKIRGVKSRVDSVSEQNHITCSLELSGIREGVNTVSVKQDCFSFPPGISILEINPASLILKVDMEIKKSIPIEVAFSGKPAAGYIIADTVTDPAQAILRGPGSVMASITVIKTKPVDVTGALETIKKGVMLDLPENVEVMFPTERISTAIYVEDNIIIREIKDVEVRGNNAGYTFGITPPVIHLKVKGPENMIEKLSTEKDVEVFLDLEDLKPGVYVRHATIRLPVNVTLVAVEPEIFTVKLENEQGDHNNAAGH